VYYTTAYKLHFKITKPLYEVQSGLFYPSVRGPKL